MTNDEIGKRIGYLMHYVLDWWTAWHQDNTDADIDAAYVKETDGGIRFGIQEDGIAIFPTVRSSAKKEPPAQTVREAMKKEVTEENKEEKSAVEDQIELENSASVFSNKEILEMPQKFRKLFRTDGIRAHIRKRTRGKSVNYEVRCRMNGFNISACGTTVEEAKKRFIEKLHAAEQGEATAIPTTYRDFCIYYFEKFRKRRVTQLTYRHDLARCENHIFPAIGNKALRKITPSDCQNLLDNLSARGMGKTADEAFCLMNAVFKGAIAHGIIVRNPLAIVFHKQHQRKHGTALTKSEEALLIATASPYRLQHIIALYTGLRPNEYSSLRREGNMLIARNSKRKGGKIEYKRIPINPMLAPHIGDMQEFRFGCLQTLYNWLRRLFPSHTLYDLRTTFYTRCRECGIADAARDEMIGHSSGVLADTYTDLSDEYLISEAQKLCYELPPVLPPNS